VPPTDTPTWWADVQQDRDKLAGHRQAEVWLEEDLDFVPRRRMSRRGSTITIERDVVDDRGADHPMHGVFVTAAPPRVIELVADTSVGPHRHDVDLHDEDPYGDDRRAADDYLSPPPPAGQRRTVQITGRPAEIPVVSRALRHRPRTTADRVGHRPDRIVLWAVVMGAILILLAILSSSSQAAELATLLPLH
jgi:hypothetical protein